MTFSGWIIVLFSAFIAGLLTALGILISALTEGKMPTETQIWLAVAMGLVVALKDIQSRLSEPPPKS